MPNLQPNIPKKGDYIHLRITANDKEKIELGAYLTGVHPSEYVRRHALLAANSDIEEQNVKNNIVLSPEDWERFITVIESDEQTIQPNLKKAFEVLSEFESGN